MKHSNRANSLLLELLLVILFFMLASVTLVEMFGAARGKSNEARAIGSALLEHALCSASAGRLLVLEKNAGAIRLYERHGFRMTDHRQRVDDTDEYFVKMEA